jgi:tetratricopeptide (TPR) repeat protein
MLNSRLNSVVKESSFGEHQTLLDHARQAIRLADYEQAQVLLNRSLMLRDRQAAEYFNLLGVVYEGQKKWRLARKCFKKANAILSNYEPAKYNIRRRGVGAARLGDEDRNVWLAQLP